MLHLPEFIYFFIRTFRLVLWLLIPQDFFLSGSSHGTTNRIWFGFRRYGMGVWYHLFFLYWHAIRKVLEFLSWLDHCFLIFFFFDGGTVGRILDKQLENMCSRSFFFWGSFQMLSNSPLASQKIPHKLSTFWIVIKKKTPHPRKSRWRFI